MTYLVDTNVLSEGMKPTPNPAVGAWLASADERELYVSVVTLAEIRFGVHLMSEGRRRKALDEWLRIDLPLRFAGRIHNVDAAIADRGAIVAAERRQQGRPMEIADALLAGTALVHGLVIVTRNTNDFGGSVPSLFDPWTGKTS